MDADFSANEAGRIECASCCSGGTLIWPQLIAAMKELVSLISPAKLHALLAPSVDVAMSQWLQENTLTPPQGLAAFWQ